MKTLEDIINYETAPLVQWEPVVGETPSEGKKKEDLLIHGEVAQVLWRLNARHITGIISDEARQELTIAEKSDKALKVTHLTLPGAFAMAAQHNVETALKAGRAGAEKVHMTTDVDSIHPHSQDAVVLNMILGCLATPESQRNIHNMLMFAARLLNAEGSLVIVRPHPEAGELETYKCLTHASELKGGENYDFIVKGLEEIGPMKNLYTPDSFLKGALDKAGFVMGATKPVAETYDTKPDKAPFLMNVCELRCSV